MFLDCSYWAMKGELLSKKPVREVTDNFGFFVMRA
jgi:hypothetical protein